MKMERKNKILQSREILWQRTLESIQPIGLSEKIG